MNSLIKSALMNGRLILLLGAGASVTAKTAQREQIPTGGKLAEKLAKRIGIDLEDGDELSDIYATAKKELGTETLIKFLEENFKHCSPSSEYIELLKFPFPRIYTFNIDDSFEKTAYQQNIFKFNVRRRNSIIEDFDMLYSSIDLIKLNGDINHPDDGFIFSQSEYGEGSSTEPRWYTELARDFHRFTFLFIGTKLKEPLFQHQVEKYKSRTYEQNSKSYLLVPSLSSAQQGKFNETNIEFISGTLSDFVEWLKKEFPNYLSANDILKRTRPEMNLLTSQERVNSTFDNVTAVSRALLSLIDDDNSISDIKSFYKGFKPSWNDILKSIPAMLYKTKTFHRKIVSPENKDIKLFLIIGAAGCGKTTALKQIALTLSETLDNNVYYIDGVINNFSTLVRSLDKRNDKKYYICVERIADLADSIASTLFNGNSDKAIIISAENLRIWRYRGEEHFGDLNKVIEDFSNITSQDVDPILDKLKQYGNWTRLEKMSLKNRRIEIIKKSKSQLLIGLMEATSGEGYPDIIRKDFESITDESEKTLLLLSGIASMHRNDASEATLVRALSYLNLNPNVYELSSKMVGLVNYKNGQVNTRHRLYIEKLMSEFISTSTIKSIIEAYIYSFTVYQFPIVKNIGAKEAAIYKGLVNFRFLQKTLKGNKSDILGLYARFEKPLEQEGLFLLQYGLALRAYNHHPEALEKLIHARQAFPESPHIEHAYAQQLLIIAHGSEDQTLADNYLFKAIEVLYKIDKFNKKEGDRYPLVSLSEGHVKILNKFNRVQEGRVVAKKYFDEINVKFGMNHGIERVKKTQDLLMRYYSTGKIKDNTLTYIY
ncbi:SIR2 family protein [Brenneria goodwinii]|uniref:Novel STAND NTPase 5 domain-containing protein n=1 Tax=Brenneria goodwinii TaxID=1109412 RepID=A0A0G4JV12_9GAMM|nr:SIR2 family protein [Brenneria goodwinii]CPR16679.1 hypothetical protein BN1221_02214c [Brenneria goodwinii]